jgi:hypothetical protein
MINTIKKENQKKRGFHMALGCRIRRNFERPSKELVEAFRGIPVANIDDNCGKIAAVDSSIFPLNPKARLLGTAFTVNAPAGDNLLFHKALDMAQPGDVIVLANKGSRMELSLSTTAVVSLLLSRIWQMLLNSGKVLLLVLMLFLLSRSRGDNPLLKAKNCIITPHISWAAQASRQRIMDITVDNIKAFLDGNTVNRVNK